VKDVKQRFSEWQNLAVTLNKGYSKSKKETLSRTHSAHCTMQALARMHMPCTRMQAMQGTLHVIMRKHAHAH
jgi:hypothetical protein